MMDVMHLADVFESYRCLCKNSRGLDPVHYHTVPSFTWDAVLEFIKANLQFLGNVDMLYDFEDLFVEV